MASLRDMKFLPSKADPCVWLRKAPSLRCYEYIAVYVDDLCIAAESPSAIIQIFKSKYHLKVKGDGKLTYHLGADYFEDPDGTFVSQPKKYIDKLADTYKRLFNEDPPKGYKTPLDKNDHPELDTSEILEGDMAAKYLTMVGQLQWLVTLGRFDIHAQVATMSRFRAAPRMGHMDRLKTIYSYAIRTKDYAIRFRTEKPDYSFLPDQDFDWTLALTGITPDISIILLFTFYQPVFYATYDQHFPSESEERAGYWVGFGEHCGDAMTHKILDQDTQKIIYRSAVRPKKSSTPNHRLAPHGGEVSTSSDPSEDKISSGSPLGSPEGSSPEQKAPTVFIRSRDEANPSGSKPMPTFDPSDLIGRTFLLPSEENGERHRAKVTRKVVEIIDQEDGQRVENINFILDIGNGKVEELISYNQLLEHLENAQDHDMGMDQELFKFRAIIGHQGPLLASDPDWKGSKYNVQVE